MLICKGLCDTLFSSKIWFVRLFLLSFSTLLFSRSNVESFISSQISDKDFLEKDDLPFKEEFKSEVPAPRQIKSFSEIIGYEKIKEKLKQSIPPLKNENGVGPKTILLKSGSGWGKTLFAKALAAESGSDLIIVNASEELLLAENGVDNVKQIFSEAKTFAKKRNNGVVIIFDNLNLAIGDYFLSQVIKDMSSMGSYAVAKAKFRSSLLQCMEELENSDDRIVFVACVCEPEIWDKPYPKELETSLDQRIEEKFQSIIVINSFSETDIEKLFESKISEEGAIIEPNFDKKLLTSNLLGLSPKSIIKFINCAIQKAKTDERNILKISDFDLTSLEDSEKKIPMSTLKGHALIGYGTKAFSAGEVEQNFSNTVIPRNLQTRLDQLVEFIKDPKKFEDKGVKIPLGIILFGNDGNGKKFIARAIAGQAGAGFLEVNCSKFGGKYSDLVAMTAKLGKPTVLFLDGIDMVGKENMLGMFGPNPLKKFLDDMDTISSGSTSNLTILASTKSLTSVANDFLKIGRFEKIIEIPSPCEFATKELLEVFLSQKGIVVDKEVDLSRVARGTIGLTREQILLMVNEAAITATFNEKNQIDYQDFEKARSAVMKECELLKNIKEDSQSGGLSRGDEKFFQSPGVFYAPNSIDTRFDDVAGCYEAKEQLQELVDYLKNPEEFKKFGVEPPSGVLMVGEPGTGKTLLARAIAGEAGRPFISVRASEFNDMYVGVGKNRMRAIFKQARQYPPCIVFFDEIDAIGSRKGFDGHRNSQTITQFLAELDGFDKDGGVIVIAATNRPDMVDEAIKRSGRLNKTINVELPDVYARERILKIHSKHNKICNDESLAQIAKATFGFNGADLKNLIKKAVLLAKKDGRFVVELNDLELARDYIYMGAENMSLIKKQDKDSIRQTAVHEAGHTLICLLDSNANPLQKVTIIPRGNALGVTWTMHEEDKLKRSKSHYLAEIKVCMGGRAAEEVIYNESYSSVTSDLENATSLARKMVKLFGMSSLGPISLSDHFEGLESESTKEKVDREIHQILENAYKQAVSIIKDNKDKLLKLADALIEKETMSAAEVKALINV